MSDANAAEAPNEPTEEAPEDDKNGFQPITSQADLNKVLTQRIERERAKFAKFNEFKAKAEQFDQLEEANKSEIQRASERMAAAEQERDEALANSLRFKIAAKFQISEEDADLFLNGTDEQTLTRQAQRLADREADRPKTGNVVRREGTATNTTSRSPAQDLATFLQGQLNE